MYSSKVFRGCIIWLRCSELPWVRRPTYRTKTPVPLWIRSVRTLAVYRTDIVPVSTIGWHKWREKSREPDCRNHWVAEGEGGGVVGWGDVREDVRDYERIYCTKGLRAIAGIQGKRKGFGILARIRIMGRGVGAEFVTWSMTKGFNLFNNAGIAIHIKIPTPENLLRFS